MSDTRATDGFSKINVHVHHVQFDPQASDGVISGFSYEQSVRPYKLEDPQLTAAAAAGTQRAAPDQRGEVPPGRVPGAPASAPTGSSRRRSPRSTPATKTHHARQAAEAGPRGRRVGGRRVRPVALVSRRRARQRVLPRPRRRPAHVAARHGRADPGRAARARRTTTRRPAPRSAPARSPTSTPRTRSSRASSTARSASSR